jgi:2,4-dienoyl-CoA reductase-like NADH-dependent reductase (Old Yellow Enzyme family)
MCQYSSQNDFATDWHFTQLGSRAVGRAGLVSADATAVLAGGRGIPQDLRIWNDAYVESLSRIKRSIHGQGNIAGMQLATTRRHEAKE